MARSPCATSAATRWTSSRRSKTKETIDKAVKDGEMGEDEGDRLLKDLDKVTKSVTDEIDTLLETKQKEIMEV